MRSFWAKVGIGIHFLMLPIIKVTLSNTTRTRVLIVAESKILVNKTWISGGKWGLPGGGVHKGESKLDCAVREVKEEVGLELEPDDLKFIGDLDLEGEDITATLSFFRVNLAKTTPLKLQFFEIIDAAWLPFNQITEANSTPDLCRALNDYVIEADQKLAN